MSSKTVLKFFRFSRDAIKGEKERERVRCVRVRERRIVVDTKTYICKFLIGLEEEK